MPIRTTILAATLGALLAMPAIAADRHGSWSGKAGHTARGSVSVVENGGSHSIILSGDWSVNRAPDPYIAFGSANTYAASTAFKRIRASGGQSVKVPSSIDPDDYSHAWVWCRRFNVPLAVARLR